MITRRTFSFASLLMAASATAIAGETIPEAAPPVPSTPDPVPTEPAGPFTATWKITPSSGKLLVSVSITNTTDAALDYVATRGNSPGTSVGAWIDSAEGDDNDISLAQVQTDKQRREMMSRMGPIPQFAAIKPKETVLAATCEFVLPKGSEGEKFRFVAYVDYNGGYQQIAFAWNPASVGA